MTETAVLNARYLAHLNYGAWSPSLNLEAVVGFMDKVDTYAEALQRYVPRDNSMLFGCVDELIERCARDEKRPVMLESPALGKWRAEAGAATA